MKKVALLSLLLVGGLAHAEDAPCPSARDNVDFIYGQPHVAIAPQPLATVLAPGAVIATEVATLAPAIEQTDRAIDVDGPIAVHLPATQKFGRRVVDGEVLPCVYWGLAAFEPPRDDEGRMFPTICLAAGEKDGSSGTLRFFAYKAAAGKGVFDAPIAPVRLRSVDESSVPGERLQVHRRLRVASIDDDSVHLINEYAALPIGATNEPNFRPDEGEMIVPLREGPIQAAGLTLTLLSIGDAWSVTPRGDFDPWVRFECDGARVKLGNAREQQLTSDSSTIPDRAAN